VKTRIVVVAIIAVSCVVALWIGLSFYGYATTPQQSSGATVAVWIRPGQNFSETIVQLQEVGMVLYPKRFRWLAYFRGDERRIRAGEYLLQRSMAPAEILETLVRGNPILHEVFVPEGSTLLRIGQILEAMGLVSREPFLEKASDPSLIKALGVEGDTFEGYLFPETYRFAKGVSAEKIIRKMVSQFHSVFTPAWNQRAREMGLSTHEVVTLASIVEKETAKPEERPLIAAVFLNRLRLGMGLESDPTVIYGIKDFDGNLTRRDLETPSPYNTYRIVGLPAGPISSPGRDSMEAVLYSSEQPYLYFVSKNDGSHHFSCTLAEHNRMVDRYQRRRSSRR
jgi:UPF0755 protein